MRVGVDLTLGRDVGGSWNSTQTTTTAMTTVITAIATACAPLPSLGPTPLALGFYRGFRSPTTQVLNALCHYFDGLKRIG